MSTSLTRQPDAVLARLEDACRSLAEARTIQEAKQIVDLASAAELYAKQQGLGQEAVDIATAVKYEALRRVGELRRDTPKNVGTRSQLHGRDASGATRKAAPEDEAPTNKKLGLTDKVSSLSQKLAALPREAFEQVRDSKASITKVLREIEHKNRPTVALPESTTYRVLYADPPWHYGNSGIINPDADNYGRAARHYPSMTIVELCALPVKKLRDTNAVLFLWVTSPLLMECAPVIDAWGFTYKTSFVWDKVRHNFGHYNSVRHELLLVCTHGACTPDVNTMPDSVQSIERSTTHSEKPEAFRSIIDALYPRGARLELFARRPAPAPWATWGNEDTSQVSA